MRAAETEHVSASVPAGELGDLVGPLERPTVVADLEAGRDDEAECPGTGDRYGRLALERGGGRLVEAAHAVAHLGARHEGASFQCQAEHLQVRDTESATDVSRSLCQLAGGRRISCQVREIALLERQPAMLWPGWQRVEEAGGAVQPAPGHGHRAIEVEVIDRQPHGHACGAGGIRSSAIETVRPLPRVEHGRRVVKPPDRPTEPLEGFRRLTLSKCGSEGCPSRLPAALGSTLPGRPRADARLSFGVSR
jgi:hypothetical protein